MIYKEKHDLLARLCAPDLVYEQLCFVFPKHFDKWTSICEQARNVQNYNLVSYHAYVPNLKNGCILIQFAENDTIYLFSWFSSLKMVICYLKQGTNNNMFIVLVSILFGLIGHIHFFRNIDTLLLLSTLSKGPSKCTHKWWGFGEGYSRTSTHSCILLSCYPSVPNSHFLIFLVMKHSMSYIIKNNVNPCSLVIIIISHHSIHY